MRTFARGFEVRPALTPWRNLARIQSQVENAFQQANDSYGSLYPRLDVYTSEEEAVVRAEIPGVSAEDIELSVEEDVLTLRGSRKADDLPEGAAWRRQERGVGDFTRRVRLPFRVEAGAVDATYSNGVLQITLPRTELDKPQKIAISVS